MRSDKRSLAPRRGLGRLATLITLLGALACADSTGPASESPPRSSRAVVPPAGTASTTYNNFYNVQVHREPFAIVVYFQYIGSGSPIFSLGTKPNVYESLKSWSPAKKMNNGYWWARVGNLTPGTLYYFRLDDLQSTWSGSAKTHRRQLIVDIDKIDVIFDGDAGIGCGELASKVDVTGFTYPSSKPYGSRFTGEYCVSSGSSLNLSDADGRFVYDDWDYDLVTIRLTAFDADACGAWAWECGDYGLAMKGLVYDTRFGPISHYFEMPTGSSWDVQLVWKGTVKTIFVP
jgi:hypothetical protein